MRRQRARTSNVPFTTRRHFLSTVAGASAGLLARGALRAEAPGFDKAQIAITLDLEMARNFPQWEDAHWDYEKGNLNQAAKDYAVQAARRVKERGGVIHTFAVGQVFEQENVDWLKGIAAEGHSIGNHTYDHIYLLAQNQNELQFRFSRSPWLTRGRPLPELIRDNIQLCTIALRERVGVEPAGFRTPGGFAAGLAGREDLQQMLLDLGFDWVSAKYPAHAGIVDLHGSGEPPSREAFDNIVAAQAESQPILYPTGLLDLPMNPISDIGAFRNGRWQLRDFLKAIRLAVEWCIEHRAMYDFLSHPSCLGVVDPGFQAIDLICDLVEQSGGTAEIASLDTIAKRARRQLGAQGPEHIRNNDAEDQK
ncbi:MAG: polysaccharide deacetylase family protein [Pirellulales bacterium]|nr:polysaccharide deacetylase family protein [Pirellulales bacterium]